LTHRVAWVQKQQKAAAQTTTLGGHFTWMYSFLCILNPSEEGADEDADDDVQYNVG
jgi:hypothetical protein